VNFQALVCAVRMVAFFLLDILILCCIGIPLFLAYRKWKQWVHQLSTYLVSFKSRKRFGWRSWVARSFLLDASTTEVVRGIDRLTQQDWFSALTELSVRNPYLAAMLPFVGRSEIPTGIEVEWLSEQTAMVKARQYSDWPRAAEPSTLLPFRQNQLVAREFLLHVESEVDNGTRVSYEVKTPTWLYILLGAIALFTFWFGQLCWEYQVGHGARIPLVLLNTLVLGVSFLWMSILCVKILTFQSICLLDGVIHTFGNPKKSSET
jgi:hypothetical protein